MDMIAAVETSYDRLGRLVVGVGPEQFDSPSSLDGWSNRRLVNHMLGFVAMMTAAAQGAPMPEEDPDDNLPDFIGADPQAAVAQFVQESLAAWRRPGVLDSQVATPLGELPGAGALALVVMETTVHGTDLARSTGQDESVDPAVADLVFGTLSSMPLDDIRKAGMFGPEVGSTPKDSPYHRALALTGRSPRP
jgi:uncharacterized protein (TIGR03086 family)